MSEMGPPGSEDRVVGLEAVDGFAFESDGTPIGELDVEAPDSLADRGATIAEQAIAERSWRFGHVIVDEAQDLTPMQWRMIARRSHGGAITMVGDLAQRSIGEPGEWADHLPIDFQGFAQQELTVNYRSPAEINDLASAVLTELAPGLAASRSIRAVGRSPGIVHLDDLHQELPDWVRIHRQDRPRGRMAVIGIDLDPADFETPGAGAAGAGGAGAGGSAQGTEGDNGAAPVGVVACLDPWQAKGLEFDSVVLVEPAALLDADHGLSLLYVALTRTTDDLAIVHQRPLPSVLADNLES